MRKWPASCTITRIPSTKTKANTLVTIESPNRHRPSQISLLARPTVIQPFAPHC
jgi:hypothetical protein